ncbi:MAG: tetratricopeptide repeat protein, partial [Planctomycetaceae bacterium]
MYGLDGAEPLIPPPHLSAVQVERLRTDAFELMVIIADAGVRMSQGEGEPVQRAAATEALEWIERTEQFGIETRAVLLLRSGYLDRLGRDAERDAARAEAEKITPSTTLDVYLLAEADRKAGRYDEALDHYHQALQLDPQHFWSMQQTALCHLQSEEPAAAVAALTACLSLRPEFLWSLYVRGVAYGELEEFDRAYQDLDTVITLTPGSPFGYVNRGGVRLYQGDLDGAIADFRQAAQLRPKWANPHIDLGEAYQEQAERIRQTEGVFAAAPVYQKALEELALAIELAPQDPRPYRIRAVVHGRLEAADVAIADYRRAAELERHPFRAAEDDKAIGRLHHAAGDWQAAVAAYDQSLALNPQDAEVHRFKAEALNALGRFEEAVESFTAYLELAEPVGDVYRARALARAALGESRASINDITRSLELEPSPNMLTRRGWAYLLKANELALQDFDEAIRLNPDNADSFNGRGYARVLLGRYEAAVSDAEEAIKLARVQLKTWDEDGKDTTPLWPLFYNAATIRAQAVKAVEQDAAKPESDRLALSEQFT